MKRAKSRRPARTGEEHGARTDRRALLKGLGALGLISLSRCNTPPGQRLDQGHGTLAALEQEIDGLGLTPAGRAELLGIVKG